MSLFVTKRLHVEAYQWVPADLTAAGYVLGALDAMGFNPVMVRRIMDSSTGLRVTIGDAGHLDLQPGHWLILHPDGVIGVVADETFHNLYEKAE